MANPHAKGASKSLKLSAKELNDFLAGLGVSPATSDLRMKYRSILSKFGAFWLRRGFRRGCIETHRVWKDSGKFPKKVTYDARRDFFDGRKRPVKVSWKRPK